VYALWFNIYLGDARSKWPATLLTDPRVLHYWDDERILGTRYLAHLPAMLGRRAPETMPPEADALRDAFFVYAPGDHWQDLVPLPISWGYPIMVTHEHLLRQVEASLAK
jgi:hypothetical protein